MNNNNIQVVDCLSLLALKVASNVFDLSSGLHHVSIRDQIVRAQLAVRDLKRGDPSLKSLLIVGAGVAGIAAALEAVDQGVTQVLVMEAGGEPFCLLRGVHKRFVGPYMYEWPSSFSHNQSYPDHSTSPWTGRSMSPLVWNALNPIPADKLALELEQHLIGRLQKFSSTGLSPLTICVKVDKQKIREFVKEFAKNESARALSRLQGKHPSKPLELSYHNEDRWFEKTLTNSTCVPQYVLLAAGMGSENIKLVHENFDGVKYTSPQYSGLPFWGNDHLLDPGTENLQLSIFGGGDGALQDVLRALTRRNHPLELISFLERDPKTKESIKRVSAGLLDAERQSRQLGNWTQNVGDYSMIDMICQRLAKEFAQQPHIARKISRCIAFGQGNVSLFVRGKYFDKAYLLNRFLVHLILACKRKNPAMWKGRMDFNVHFEQSAVAYMKASNGQHIVKIKQWNATPPTSYSHMSDMIAVRYGITPGTVPGAQMIQVSSKPSKQRTTLAKIELPFVVERT